MITYQIGDLVADGPNVIAHGVNCRGAMGAGIARQIGGRYPDARARHHVACIRKEFHIGSAQYVVCGISGKFASRGIYNLGTQELPGANATGWGVYLSFANMAEHAKANGITKIGIPRIGCGIGGLTWDGTLGVVGVERQILSALADTRTDEILEIAVYDLPVSAVLR